MPFREDREHRHAPGAALARRLHDGDGEAEAVGERLLRDDRRLEEAALRDHDVRLDALLAREDVHAEPKRREAAVELRAHEIREVHAAVRRAHEERPSRLDLRDVLAGEAAVIEQSARVRVRLSRRAEQRPVELLARKRPADGRGELAEELHPRVEVARAVVRVHHRDGRARRRRDHVDVAVHLPQRRVEHVHRERRRTDADVARALAHGVRADHARARVALRRRHERARRELAAEVEETRALRREMARARTRAQHARQDIEELPRLRRDARQRVELRRERRIIGAARLVDGEHPRRVADAEHPLAREPPVHIARERREEVDLPGRRLAVQDGLIEMRDAPALRYIEGKLLRERVGRLARDVVAPRAESRELPPVACKRQIAVHHRADADAAERLERRLVARGDLRLDLREAGLDPGPDLLEIIRPDPVLELVLPAIARRRERPAILADEHRLDVRRAELDAERRLARADLLRPACFLLAIFCHKASLLI